MCAWGDKGGVWGDKSAPISPPFVVRRFLEECPWPCPTGWWRGRNRDGVDGSAHARKRGTLVTVG
eukprot:6302210-Prymnesium_polylepis.1